MDIVITIIVIVCAIYADRKKKAKKAQGNTGRINQQTTAGKSRTGQMGNTVQSAANVMQKNMTQSQRELKERLQKKYGSAAGGGRAASQPYTQNSLQQSAGKQPYMQNNVQPAVGSQQPNVQGRGAVQSADRRVSQPAGSQQPYPQNSAEENMILSRAAANVQEEAVDELRFEQMGDTAVDSLGIAMIENSPLMQQISDLMITGYTGKLSFERDFVAEGVEMLNRCETMGF